MIKGHGTDDHSDKCYRVRVTTTGHAITRMKRHMKSTIINLQKIISSNEIAKDN